MILCETHGQINDYIGLLGLLVQIGYSMVHIGYNTDKQVKIDA